MAPNGARVLLVDDEPDILAALGIYLEGALGVQVSRANGGQEALDLLEKGPLPDLIVSDYRMPGMDGLTFLAQVRSRWPEVPRILLTAFPDMQLAIRALNETHIERFLSKPVQPEELLKVVEGVLSASRHARLARKAFDRAKADAERRKA